MNGVTNLSQVMNPQFYRVDNGKGVKFDLSKALMTLESRWFITRERPCWMHTRSCQQRLLATERNYKLI